MTWKEQLDWLKTLEQMFPDQGPYHFSSPTDDSQARHALEEVEQHSTESVDAAVRDFSKSGRWPVLSNDQKFFLFHRIQFAILITMALLSSDNYEKGPILPNPPPSFLIRDQYEWLLIWAWKVPGKYIWMERLLLQAKSARKTSSE